MNHLDLFTGIGGFSLAAERSGVRTVAHSEVDRYANACLERRWPGVSNLGDVSAVTKEDFHERIDIITAGSPCQDYSVAGKRAGTAGARSGLIEHTFRLTDELKPTWLVIENVPGLLSSNGGRDLGAVLGTLGDLGMGFAWRVLDAQALGVPQRRRRVFIVGRAGGSCDGPREVLSVGEGLPGDTPPSSEARKANAAGAAAGVGVAGVAGTMASRGRGGGFPGTDEAVSGYVVPVVANTLTGVNSTMDKGQTMLPVAMAENQRAEVRAMDTFGALAARPSGKPGQGSPVVVDARVRKLTPLECERLQGFPDGWTEGSSDTQRYRQLGNAVAVPVAEWIMGRMVQV